MDDKCEGCEKIEKRLEAGDLAIHNLRASVAQIQSDTSELLEIFRASKGFIKVMGWAGNGIRWLVLTAASAGALWVYLHHGSNK